MKTLDNFYFGNTLLADMKKRLSKPISYLIVDNPGTNAAMKTVSEFKDGQTTSIQFILNIAQFGIRGQRRIDGILVTNTLEALVVTCEHELCHAIIEVYHMPGTHHGEVFRKINNRLFGHSENVYTYTDESPIEV